MAPLVKMVGLRFGRLLVIARDLNAPLRVVRWHCLCDCGIDTIATANHLRRGDTKSCGCLKEETLDAMSRKHGASKTSEYAIWEGMKRRCASPVTANYHRYGGRGISVCERWSKFENFIADMGCRPSKLHTLEREDNDGNYEPSNCRWATRKDQAYNRTTTAFFTVHGKRLTYRDISDRIGVDVKSLRTRLGRRVGTDITAYLATWDAAYASALTALEAHDFEDEEIMQLAAE